MRDSYIGIDNGVTGSIGILGPGNTQFFSPTPVKKQLNYQKKKAWINRVDVVKLKKMLSVAKPENCLVLVERPMVNPTRFVASTSALRALEATLIVIEELGLPIRYVDSKEWQSEILPKGVEGPDELKAASLSIGQRLFPSLAFKRDADSILIAEWARRNNL